jgi:hypothetical protein
MQAQAPRFLHTVRALQSQTLPDQRRKEFVSCDINDLSVIAGAPPCQDELPEVEEASEDATVRTRTSQAVLAGATMSLRGLNQTGVCAHVRMSPAGGAYVSGLRRDTYRASLDGFHRGRRGTYAAHPRTPHATRAAAALPIDTATPGGNHRQVLGAWPAPRFSDRHVRQAHVGFGCGPGLHAVSAGAGIA